MDSQTVVIIVFALIALAVAVLALRRNKDVTLKLGGGGVDLEARSPEQAGSAPGGGDIRDTKIGLDKVEDSDVKVHVGHEIGGPGD